MTDLWDEVVGIPVSRFACARSVWEVRHYARIRDGLGGRDHAGRPTETVVPYPDGHWPTSVDQLAKAIRSLAGAY